MLGLGRRKDKTYVRRFGLWWPVKDAPKPLRATLYPPCPLCGLSVWVPKSRPETRYKHVDLYILQYFDCAGCGLRTRLNRTVNSMSWQHSMTYTV